MYSISYIVRFSQGARVRKKSTFVCLLKLKIVDHPLVNFILECLSA